MTVKRGIISLAGQWRFALDPQNAGIRQRWFARSLDDSIALPGSTDGARKGSFVNEHCDDRLSRLWRWVGPAWYQKCVIIPPHWKGRRTVLFLERTKDSQVWVDETWVGSDDSLSTPHVFDLSAQLTPGQHTITILVDNAKMPPVGPCHQVDERTQTNWNGIVGRIELQATDTVWIDDLQVYPDRDTCRVRVVALIGTTGRGTEQATAVVSATVGGAKKPVVIKSRRFPVRLEGSATRAVFAFPLPATLPLWDEFNRPLIRLTMQLTARSGGRTVRDTCSVTFGMRSFSTRQGQFIINGQPTLLRGKNDAALFPLTGYAPMDKKEWVRLLAIARNYGINHYRFHSWCPPEAAFAAADDLGIYFQIELPNKREITAPGNKNYRPPQEAYETLAELEGDGGPPALRTAYLAREGERILKAYGNHPSFTMMTLGNELGGDVAVMKGMCDHFRSLDRRHLYAMGTGHFHWDIKYRKGDEFWVTRATAKGKNVRAASWESECHVDHQSPSTTVDYHEALKGVPVPVVGHEMAQYEVYPDYHEIKKYQGVLRARNLEIFRERLKKAGMLDQAGDFFKASGALSVICHREDVEAALRTPGFGGFQMLDLQDFSGQGTALVGMLDVFMDSKGLITPKKWREFCCETVPLLGMTKYTWTTDEILCGKISVAHYGPVAMNHQAVVWQIRAGARVVAQGRTRAMTIPTGTVTEVGSIRTPLGGFRQAGKLTVRLSLPGTPFRNGYDLWVYPAMVPTAVPETIVVARSFSRKVQAALDAGARVLLLPHPDRIKQSVAMAFQSGFWSPMFRKGGKINPLGKETPGTQGILCNPAHPLFNDFPTEFHSNWQWWHMVKNARALILDATPKKYRPVVQVIDGFDRNHKLGLVCETKVGKGRLLICSIDLPALQAYPEARQLLHSLLGYIDSAAFAPRTELDCELIRNLCGT